MAKKEFAYRGKSLEELQTLSLKELMELFPARQRRTLKRGFNPAQKKLLEELKKNYILITDNMAGHLMKKGQISVVITGADRIARNGDTANKIGTYAVAVLAKEHGLPFYVAAPLSTIDFSLTDGDAIPIEERNPEEVKYLAGQCITVPDIEVRNPAFDVTPAKYITAIITEKGIAKPPFLQSLAAFST